MGDQWLNIYQQASSKADKIQADIGECQRLARAQQSVSVLTTQIRKQLNELSIQISSLDDKLAEAERGYHFTEKEVTRRQDLILNLKSRRERYLQESSNMKYGDDDDHARASLLGTGTGGRGGGRRVEDDRTRGLDNRGLMQEQDMVMQEQDKGLDILAQSIRRQKQLGLAIGDELDDHNEMLGELANGMDNTERRLKKETAHVVRVSEKAKTGGMLCCIVLLILAIIVVAAAPI